MLVTHENIVFISQLAEAGKVPMEAVKLFDEISQEALEITKSYFKLDSELYFDYTHLVCRTALKSKSANMYARVWV